MRIASASNFLPIQNTHLSHSQVELDHLAFGFGQSFQIKEISAFELGALTHALFRVSTSSLPLLSQNPFLSQLISKSLSVLAVGAESFGIESFRRLFSADESTENFKDSWIHNFVQIGMLRSLNTYFPTQSFLLRHLSTDAICLLSQDLLEVSTHHEQSLSKRLFDLEVQNWQWSLSSQFFHLASSGSLQVLQEACERRASLSIRDNEHEISPSEISIFSSNGDRGSIYAEATFTHPNAVEAYFEWHKIDPAHTMVTFKDEAGNTMMAAWKGNEANFRRSFNESPGGLFFVQHIEMHPVPEFAHLRPIRLIEDILPILEHCDAFTERFPHGILRHSLQYLGEVSPRDLYFLRRKVATFENPLSEDFQYDLRRWFSDKLREMPEGAKPCPWILANLNDFEWRASSNLEVEMGRHAFVPAYAWRFNEIHYTASDVEKRHFELVDKTPRRILDIEMHLRELDAWVGFLARSNLWASRFLSIKNHLTIVFRMERFGEGRSFQIASSILLKIFKLQYKNFDFAALVPIVMHPQFRNSHYSLLFDALRAEARSETVYLDNLLRHGIYLYDLTRDFSLKEEFERAMANSGAASELRSARIQEFHEHFLSMLSS